MARPKFKRDSKGIEQILKSAKVAKAIHSKAEQVRSATVTSLGFDARDGVVVDDYTTDRAASSVTIRDPRALAAQATTGVLTKSATAAGLEIGRRKRGKR